MHNLTKTITIANGASASGGINLLGTTSDQGVTIPLNHRLARFKCPLAFTSGTVAVKIQTSEDGGVTFDDHYVNGILYTIPVVAGGSIGVDIQDFVGIHTFRLVTVDSANAAKVQDALRSFSMTFAPVLPRT